jgi:RNA-dependent RNA polymerase
MVGHIAILHLRISDLKRFDDPECLILAEKAAHAVDFPKVGIPVDWRDLPRPPSWQKPDFLSGEGVNPSHNDSGYYPSTKVLGHLYRKIPNQDLHFKPKHSIRKVDFDLIWLRLGRVTIGDIVMRDLLAQPPDELMEEMESVLLQFCERLFHIAQSHTVSRHPDTHLSEAEIVGGTSQERFTDHKKRKEMVAAMNLQVRGR